MNIEQARFNMIEQQIRPWDVLDTQILDLLLVVKREEFVPAAHKSLAFMDTEIPLTCDENMLSPKFEARILQEAGVQKHEQVLEIGAGSGYMAALLAHRARHVTSVEVEAELQALAQANLQAAGIKNAEVVLGNGAQGWGTNQYDVIVISGSLPVLPDAFLQQLKIGGRLLVVIGEAPVMAAQMITRSAEIAFHTVTLFETAIKPLRGAVTPSHFTF
ncbi:MAG: protein-L-isoaspartate O-methyltransferase family protein [Janthinobacterium lividum]